MTTPTTHRSHTHSRYGLTCEDYDALLTRQEGLCGICREALDLVVDHDHMYDERAVRGLLCHPCNAGLRPVDAGRKWPTSPQRAYLVDAWHLEHRPGLPLLTTARGHVDLSARPVGVGEAASIAGVSPKRIQQLALRPGFPEPWAVLQQGTMWRDTDIKAWAATRNTTRGRPKKATS